MIQGAVRWLVAIFQTSLAEQRRQRSAALSQTNVATLRKTSQTASPTNSAPRIAKEKNAPVNKPSTLLKPATAT